MNALHVWIEDRLLGTLTKTRARRLQLDYTDETVTEFAGAPWLSCSLPVSRRTTDATLFFSGLLPEGDHRRAMAEIAGVLTTDIGGLLGRFGRDVAGAVVVSASSDPPSRSRGEVELLDDTQLDTEVAALPGRVLGLHDDSELSLDGMQDKMLLIDLGDQGWGRPVGGRPSTHILKLDDPRFPGLVAAEAACMKLALDVGVTSVSVQTTRHGTLDAIIIERFDRAGTVEAPVRVHQEDACQATGRDPNLLYKRKPMGKYQIAGGPSLRDVAKLLRTHAADPEHELERLLALAVFTVSIGNADAHGKNIGLLHPNPHHVELAPAYDTVPTVLWSGLPTRAAMFVNGKADINDVTGDDLAIEATTWGVPLVRAEAATAIALDRLSRFASQLGHDLVAELVTGRVKRLTTTLT